MIGTRKIIFFIGTLVGLITISVIIVMGQSKPKVKNISTSYSNNTSKARSLSSTSLLDEYHEVHLTPAQADRIYGDIHDQGKFEVTQDYSLDNECADTANAKILETLNSQRTVLVVNGQYPIVRTPNIQSWSRVQAELFMQDPTISCGAGSFFPFEVQPDYILWRAACSTGALPLDSNGKLSQSFLQCIQAQEVISREYHLQD